MKDTIIRGVIRVLSSTIEVLYGLQNTPVWRSFDGTVTPISKMKSDHLINAVKRMKRNNQESKYIYPFMMRELVARGFNPSDVITRAYDRIIPRRKRAKF